MTLVIACVLVLHLLTQCAHAASIELPPPAPTIDDLTRGLGRGGSVASFDRVIVGPVPAALTADWPATAAARVSIDFEDVTGRLQHWQYYVTSQTLNTRVRLQHGMGMVTVHARPPAAPLIPVGAIWTSHAPSPTPTPTLALPIDTPLTFGEARLAGKATPGEEFGLQYVSLGVGSALVWILPPAQSQTTITLNLGSQYPIPPGVWPYANATLNGTRLKVDEHNWRPFVYSQGGFLPGVTTFTLQNLSDAGLRFYGGYARRVR